MIIRLSQQMMKKLGLAVTLTAEPADNPLCDWSVHLFRSQRTQYVLAVNSTSLFAVTFYGRGVTDERSFLGAFLTSLLEHHEAARLETAYTELIRACTNTIIWSKAGNRSVTGSMNEMIYHAKWTLEEEALTTVELSNELNDNILSYIKYQNPLEAHRNLIKLQLTKLQQS